MQRDQFMKNKHTSLHSVRDSISTSQSQQTGQLIDKKRSSQSISTKEIFINDRSSQSSAVFKPSVLSQHSVKMTPNIEIKNNRKSSQITLNEKPQQQQNMLLKFKLLEINKQLQNQFRKSSVSHIAKANSSYLLESLQQLDIIGAKNKIYDDGYVNPFLPKVNYSGNNIKLNICNDNPLQPNSLFEWDKNIYEITSRDFMYFQIKLKDQKQPLTLNLYPMTSYKNTQISQNFRIICLVSLKTQQPQKFNAEYEFENCYFKYFQYNKNKNSVFTEDKIYFSVYSERDTIINFKIKFGTDQFIPIATPFNTENKIQNDESKLNESLKIENIQWDIPNESQKIFDNFLQDYQKNIEINNIQQASNNNIFNKFLINQSRKEKLKDQILKVQQSNIQIQQQQYEYFTQNIKLKEEKKENAAINQKISLILGKYKLWQTFWVHIIQWIFVFQKIETLLEIFKIQIQIKNRKKQNGKRFMKSLQNNILVWGTGNPPDDHIWNKKSKQIRALTKTRIALKTLSHHLKRKNKDKAKRYICEAMIQSLQIINYQQKLHSYYNTCLKIKVHLQDLIEKKKIYKKWVVGEFQSRFVETIARQRSYKFRELNIKIEERRMKNYIRYKGYNNALIESLMIEHINMLIRKFYDKIQIYIEKSRHYVYEQQFKNFKLSKNEQKNIEIPDYILALKPRLLFPPTLQQWNIIFNTYAEKMGLLQLKY